MIMKTCDGECIETFFPFDRTELPECIESNLNFANFPEHFTQQIVNYFEELVYCPLCEMVLTH